MDDESDLSESGKGLISRLKKIRLKEPNRNRKIRRQKGKEVSIKSQVNEFSLALITTNRPSITCSSFKGERRPQFDSTYDQRIVPGEFYEPDAKVMEIIQTDQILTKRDFNRVCVGNLSVEGMMIDDVKQEYLLAHDPTLFRAGVNTLKQKYF